LLLCITLLFLATLSASSSEAALQALDASTRSRQTLAGRSSPLASYQVYFALVPKEVPPHVFLRLWGGNAALLDNPQDVASTKDRIYVADALNNRVQVFDLQGQHLATIGTLGTAEGQFDLPHGIAVDKSGTVYVADTRNHRIQVFDADGAFLHQWGNHGTDPQEFGYPWGIAVHNSGTIYGTDTGNHRIQVFTSDGVFLRQWGSWGTGTGEFDDPRDLAVDPSGIVYVVDSDNDRIQAFTPEGVFLR
jgi:sugar lactone lactonase YvrE